MGKKGWKQLTKTPAT